MPRNFKVLGTALVAMLAMSVVSASAASAEAITSQRFTASQYPAWVHAENTVGVEKFTTEAGAVECTSTFTGTMSEASTTLTVHPTYVSCKAFGFIEASVSTVGCDYVFHLTTTASNLGTGGVSEKTHGYQAHVDVTCSEGSSIKIVAPVSLPRCRIEVKSQSGLTTVDLHSMAGSGGSSKNDATVLPTVSGIQYTVTEDKPFCPFGGTGTKSDGSYTASAYLTVRAYEHSDPSGLKGEQIDADIGQQPIGRLPSLFRGVEQTRQRHPFAPLRLRTYDPRMSDGSAGLVLPERRGAVLVLTLNRPERLNAWTDGLEARYFEHLDAAEADPEVRRSFSRGPGAAPAPRPTSTCWRRRRATNRDARSSSGRGRRTGWRCASR